LSRRVGAPFTFNTILRLLSLARRIHEGQTLVNVYAISGSVLGLRELKREKQE